MEEKVELCGEKDEVAEFKKGKFSKVLIGFSIFGALMCAVSFNDGRILSGILAIAITGLFVLSYLMGIHVIKEKKKGIRIIAAILAFGLLIPYFNLYNADGKSGKKFKWNEIELSYLLPKPESNKGRIQSNTSMDLWMDVCKISRKQYENYIENCIDKGFDVEAERAESYNAFNQEGYKLSLSYNESEEEMTIGLSAPEEMGEFQWPNSMIGRIVPMPASDIGRIEWENEKGFHIYVGQMPREKYNEYVQLCADSGFDVDYSKNDDYYYADSKKGYHISLTYEGNCVMSVLVEEKEEAKVGVTAVSFDFYSDEIVLQLGNSKRYGNLEIDTVGDISVTRDMFVEVSENEEIATIKISEDLHYEIIPISIGITYVYVETADDETITTGRIKVVVEQPVEEMTEQSEETTAQADETDNSPTVYITPTGQKYHYSSSCAGSNAIAKKLSDVQNSYGPCKKCAQ